MDKKRPYRFIDHTADFGLHIFGATRRELYENAALALFDQIVDAETVVGRASDDLTIEGTDRTDLMVNWLRELLYLWTGEEKLVKTVRVRRLSNRDLAAAITHDAFDSGRHEIKTEIKAVTYHQSQVYQTPDGWEAKIIFDV